MASAVSLGSTVRGAMNAYSGALPPLPLTAWQSMIRDSSRNCLLPKRGLAMISTAPYSSALSALCAPSSARLEQITTGIGCWLMIFCRNVRPSMRGISISSVITSGTCSRIRSAATKGSEAVPMISISGSLESTSLRVWRTTAESSTIRTRIFGVLIRLDRAASSVRSGVLLVHQVRRIALGEAGGATPLRFLC